MLQNYFSCQGFTGRRAAGPLVRTALRGCHREESGAQHLLCQQPNMEVFWQPIRGAGETGRSLPTSESQTNRCRRWGVGACHNEAAQHGRTKVKAFRRLWRRHYVSRSCRCPSLFVMWLVLRLLGHYLVIQFFEMDPISLHPASFNLPEMFLYIFNFV